MQKFGVIFYNENKIVVQEAEYIEHGFVIEIIHNEIALYEIPYGGGDKIHIGNFHTLLGAIEKANKLT